MQLQNGYGVANIPNRSQQRRDSSPTTNSTMPLPNLQEPNVVSQQIQHPQQILQHQIPFFWQQQQQRQQPIVDPLSFSSFRLGVNQPNCNLLPHNLAGIGGGVVGGGVVTPQALHWQHGEYGAGKAALWKCDTIGSTGQQQFGNGELNCRRIGGFGESEKQQSRSSGSASEIFETQCPNPGTASKGVHREGGGEAMKINSGEEEKLERQLSSMARYLETQLTAHHERFHQRFMAVLEKIERERKEREETWLAREAEKARLQGMARDHERAVALRRENVIVSYLEKITGQKIELPPRDSIEVASSNVRWPRGEVEALIRVRNEMEMRLREQASNGALWEEISVVMGRMGYQRSAKRCKEKWENINTYFRKAKDGYGNGNGGGGVRKKMKTCSYSDLLNQHYSKPALQVQEKPNCSSYNTNDNNVGNGSCEPQVHGEENELLEAMIELRSNDVHQLNQRNLNADDHSLIDFPESNDLKVSGEEEEAGDDDNNG